jgi:hypothetical protein
MEGKGAAVELLKGVAMPGKVALVVEVVLVIVTHQLLAVLEFALYMAYKG